MHHRGTIAGVELESECEFIVYGHSLGLIAECAELDNAKRALRNKLAEANECNVLSDLGIFRWSNGRWMSALSPYEIQEWEVQRNPSRAIRFP